MNAKTLATLTNTGADAWILAEARTGNILTGLTGPEALVLKSAAASLVADHHYPEGGTWVRRGPGRHCYRMDQ